MSDEPKKGPPESLLAHADRQMRALVALGLLTTEQAKVAGAELVKIAWRGECGEITEEEMRSQARALAARHEFAPQSEEQGS